MSKIKFLALVVWIYSVFFKCLKQLVYHKISVYISLFGNLKGKKLYKNYDFSWISECCRAEMKSTDNIVLFQVE